MEVTALDRRLSAVRHVNHHCFRPTGDDLGRPRVAGLSQTAWPRTNSLQEAGAVSSLASAGRFLGCQPRTNSPRGSSDPDYGWIGSDDEFFAGEVQRPTQDIDDLDILSPLCGLEISLGHIVKLCKVIQNFSSSVLGRGLRRVARLCVCDVPPIATPFGAFARHPSASESCRRCNSSKSRTTFFAVAQESAESHIQGSVSSRQNSATIASHVSRLSSGTSLMFSDSGFSSRLSQIEDIVLIRTAAPLPGPSHRRSRMAF